MTDRFMTKTPLEGGFYPVREFLEDGKKWYVVSNAKGEYNFADSTGRILCEKEFKDYASHAGKVFTNGFAIITQQNGYLNFVNENGDFVIKDESIKVAYAAVFGDEVAKVTLDNGKVNFLTKDGTLILPYNHTYDNALVFKNGFGTVSKKGKVNFVDSSGKLISKVWFQDVVGFNDYGYACCLVKDKGWNVINTDGNKIFKKYYKSIGTAGNIIIVEDKDIYLFRCYCGEVWCIETVMPNYYEIEVDKENECIILKDTYFLEPKVKVFLFSGETVFNEWIFEDIKPIRITTCKMDRELFFLVKKKNAKGKYVYAIMNKNGKYAFTKKWFQNFDGELRNPKEYVDYVTVMYNGKWYKLNFWDKNSLTPIKWCFGRDSKYYPCEII